MKGNLSSKHLERAIRYAVERQALLRALEITQKQQLEFKNQFLSHVSHELRTPLTCIHQYVTLLLDGLAGFVPPEQSDHLKTVLKSVNQLHAMIRDMLEATRADSGKMRIEPRCIALGELVQQTVAMLRPTAEQKKIKLEMGMDADSSSGSRRSRPGSRGADQPGGQCHQVHARKRDGHDTGQHGGGRAQLFVHFGERHRARHWPGSESA